MARLEQGRKVRIALHGTDGKRTDPGRWTGGEEETGEDETWTKQPVLLRRKGAPSVCQNQSRRIRSFENEPSEPELTKGLFDVRVEQLKCWRLKGEEPPNVADLAPPPPPKRSLTGNFDQAAHTEGQAPPQVPQGTGQTGPGGRNAFRNTARVRPMYPTVGNFSTQGSSGLGVPGLPAVGQDAAPPVNLFVPTAGAGSTAGPGQAQTLQPNIESSVQQALTRSIQTLGESVPHELQAEGGEANHTALPHEYGEAPDDELEQRDIFGQEIAPSFDELPDEEELHLESASGYQTPHSTSSFMNFRSPDAKNGLTSDMVPPRTFAEAVAINEGCSDVEAEFGSDTETDVGGEQATAQLSIPTENHAAAGEKDSEIPPCPSIDGTSGWHYRDLYGAVQGPFQIGELQGWREYLPPELRVWQTQEELYWELHLLLSASLAGIPEPTSNGTLENGLNERKFVSESIEQAAHGSPIQQEERADVDQGLRQAVVESDELAETTASDINHEFADLPVAREHDKTLEVGGPTSGEGVSAMGSEISYLQRQNKELQAEIDSLRDELECLRNVGLSDVGGDSSSKAADPECEEVNLVQDQQSQMSDLLTCLGQEGAKIEKLKLLLMDKGMPGDELDQILEAVEEEYGFEDIQGVMDE